MIIKRIYTKAVKSQDWKGFEYTGEIIEIEHQDSVVGSITNAYRVVKGKFTPYGGIRDCGNHYIKANYSSYDRIDKKTLLVTRNVEDR